MPVETEAAWVAGFIDGEAHLAVRFKNGRPHGRIGISNTDMELLLRVRDFFGAGAIHPQKPNHLSKKPLYSYDLAAAEPLIRGLAQLLPYAGTRTKNRVKEIIERVSPYL